MSGTRGVRRGRRWAAAAGVALLSGALVCAAAACNSDDSTGVPTGSGDNVTVDNDATTQPGLTADAGADSPFARVEGGYAKPDGYDPYGVCQKCACPATDYCFGGGTGYTTFSGTCPQTTFGVGCNAVPAACATDASCECLLMATASQLPCYAVCVQNSRTVYCPTP